MYHVEFDPVAEQQRDALPAAAGAAFMELRTFLEVSPWNGRPFQEAKPDGNMRMQTFGDGLGSAVYIVMEERRLVYVIRVTWLG